MQFEFECIESLPRLSWCARVHRGGLVTVRHGQAVETRADRFVEGAWDGDFDEFEFDRAQNLAGSGGVIRAPAVVFAAPFHPLEHLHVLRGEDGILVSNSLPFVLEAAGDRPDPAYPDYFFDYLRMVRRGIARQPATLRTELGRKVELYATCRLVIDSDLRLTCSPAPLGPPPADYAGYFGSLLGAAQRIVSNAADPGRNTIYQAVAACSRGYDSTATAALASRVGCREGLTFVRSGSNRIHPLFGPDKPLADDSGADTLRALGMKVNAFDRLELPGLPGHPRAEFFYGYTAGTDASLRLMEDKLRGSVFFSGRHGERYWGPTARCRRLNFREVDDVNLSGRTYTEFRLRVGYIHLPAPYIGALHGPAIHRITHSGEMRPWRLNTGYYDRPIARRMAEEAGVPRENFGHVKLGGSDEAGRLGIESTQDLLAFVEREVPADIRRRLHDQTPAQRRVNHNRVKYLRTNYSHFPLASRTLELLGTDRLHRLWNSTYLYFFHWGIDKVRTRYAVLST